MKYLLIILGSLALVFPIHAQNISTQCVSESGKSIYSLSFDLIDKTGIIRYRFMDQDVTYAVAIDVVNTLEVWGRAEFKSSRSGKIRGNPFSFTYYVKEKKFKEMNILAKCR